jgi:hypothetical protein
MATKREARLALADAARIFEERVGSKVGVHIVRVEQGDDGWGLRVNLPFAPRENVKIPDDVNGVPTQHVIREFGHMY